MTDIPLRSVKEAERASGQEAERASDQEAQRNDHLERLAQVSRGFTYASSLSEIMHYAAEQAAHLLDAQKAILMLADDDGLLRVHACFGVPDDVVHRFRASFDESLIARLNGLFDSTEGFLGVPLVVQGRVIGLLAVMITRELDADDEWLLSTLADQMSAPLENAQFATRIEQAALLVENARLYESERAARKEADAARVEAECQRRVAESASQAKSDFIAHMSHELRTPLNAIAGYVQIMEMGIHGEVTEAQHHDLRRIEQNQRVLLGLVNNVLNIARIESGHVEFNMGDVPLHESLDAMVGLVMPQLMAGSLQYDYVPVDQLLTVHADGDKLQQITLNLLTNAIKYTSPGGVIRLSAEDVGDAVLVHVGDNGRGIPADKLGQIFDPFVRIDIGYVRATEGTGLGLSISRDLARAMCGDLTVRSTLGEGSIFTLRLPKASRTSSAA